jgi:hypothetical protein
LIYFSFLLKVALFYRRHRITPFQSLLVGGRANYLKTYLARTPSHIVILVVHVCPSFLWAADQAGENAYCAYISHNFVPSTEPSTNQSQNEKGGGREEERRGVEEAEGGNF